MSKTCNCNPVPEFPNIHSTDCPMFMEQWSITVPGIYVPGQNGKPQLIRECVQSELTPGLDPAAITEHFVTGMTVVEEKKEEIEQKIVPSTGTKLVCTTCGRQDWHVLILRRKAGLIEGLCKQSDGSGCYPLATRRNCQYTYPNQIDCPQVAEYCVALGEERLNPMQVCRDHVGEVLRQGPLYQVWPLED